ncbi:MAG: ATP-binding protein [Cytophagaceae bacterium]|nr:ATP-binding protein [Cytophagaceae bacterium]
MNEKLIVKNFGPIRDAELELKKTTVLIGPQGSGKSTLAKLVAVFVNNEYDQISKQSPNNRPSIGIEFHDYGLLDYLKEETILNFLTGATQFSYDISFGIDVIENSENSEKFTAREDLYIPAERVFISSISNSLYGLMSSRIFLPKTLTVFGSRFEFATEIFPQFDTLLNVQYFRGTERKSMIRLENGQEISLSATSSGHQALIPLQMVVESELVRYKTQQATLFTIEEPELNLYPTTQKRLIYYLADRCTQNQNKLLMTTHSPYVLTSLNMLLLAYSVWQKHPEREADIAAIVPRESWLNPEEFAAYYVADGTVRSITDPETMLISDNELDGVSEDNAGDLDLLMKIYRSKSKVNEEVN